MTFPNTPENCPGYAPGMALPHNVCERCGGDRQRDHIKGQRAEAVHYLDQNRNVAAGISKDQKIQGVRRLGPFPLEVEYPCGCKASGGTGIEPLPGYCPNHPPDAPDPTGQAVPHEAIPEAVIPADETIPEPESPVEDEICPPEAPAEVDAAPVEALGAA